MALKILFSVNVYGEFYQRIFFRLQVPSLVDGAKFNTHEVIFHFYIYTTFEWSQNQHFLAEVASLMSQFPVRVLLLPALPQERFFENRYKYLSIAASHSISEAKELGMLVHLGVADHVFGASFWKNALEKISEGFDGVLANGYRVVDELFSNEASKLISQGPLDPDTLLNLCHNSIAPLWLAANAECQNFSVFPFFITWSDRDSLLLYSYGFQPVLFHPSDTLVEIAMNASPDTSVSSFIKRPFIAQEFVDFPLVKVSTLSHLYIGSNGVREVSFFGRERASAYTIAAFLSRFSFSDKSPGVVERMLSHPVSYRFTGHSGTSHLVEKAMPLISEIRDRLRLVSREK